jgi:hypothetical protein
VCCLLSLGTEINVVVQLFHNHFTVNRLKELRDME